MRKFLGVILLASFCWVIRGEKGDMLLFTH